MGQSLPNLPRELLKVGKQGGELDGLPKYNEDLTASMSYSNIGYDSEFLGTELGIQMPKNTEPAEPPLNRLNMTFTPKTTKSAINPGDFKGHNTTEGKKLDYKHYSKEIQHTSNMDPFRPQEDNEVTIFQEPSNQKSLFAPAQKLNKKWKAEKKKAQSACQLESSEIFPQIYKHFFEEFFIVGINPHSIKENETLLKPETLFKFPNLKENENWYIYIYIYYIVKEEE